MGGHLHSSSSRHGHGSSKRSEAKRERPWHWESMWFCCQCHPGGAGPMAFWTDHCPNCSHLRCLTCIVENIKIIDDRGGSGGGYVGASGLPPPQTPRTLPFLFCEPAKIEPTSHRDIPKTTSPRPNKLESEKTPTKASSTLPLPWSSLIGRKDSLDKSLPSDANSAVATIFSSISSRPTTSCEVSSSQINLQDVARPSAADEIAEKTSQIDLSSTAAARYGRAKGIGALQMERLPDAIKDKDSIELPCLDPRISFAGDHKLSTSIDLPGPNHSLAKGFTPQDTSSPRSPEHSGVFTDENSSTDTDMDWDTDSKDSGDDDAETEPENAHERNMLQTLDLCLSTACRHNLPLAAILIPQIHAVVASWNHNGRSYTPSEVGEAGNTDAGDGNGASSSHAAEASGSQYAATGGVSCGQSGKRPRDPNDPGRPNKRQRKSSEEGTPRAEAALADAPTFACHFHKKDPDKYNRQNRVKYANCPHPTIPQNDLRRRLKDHFKNHRLAQCDRCYSDFGNSEALVEHRQSPDGCEIRPASFKEGIDDGQWKRIEYTLYKKTDKGKSDFDKWFDIWKILFPDAPPPRTPWNESEPPPLGPAPNNEVIVRNFELGMASAVDQGLLPRDPQLYQYVISILRGVLETQEVNSTSLAVRVPGVDGRPIHEFDTNSGTGTNDESVALSWFFTAADHTDETSHPPNVSSNLQLSAARHGHGNHLNSTIDATALESGTNQTSDPQSNVPSPDWGSFDVPFLLAIPDPRSSNFGLDTSSDLSMDTADRPYEYGITNDDADDYFNIDTFMAQECLYDASENQGDAFEFYHRPENLSSRGDTMTDLSAILEPELRNLDRVYLESTEEFSRKDRNKGLKEQFRLGFGG